MMLSTTCPQQTHSKNSYSAPIYQLPCELLIQILQEVLLNASTGTLKEQYDVPNAFRLVSKLWYYVVQNTPSLSSLIYVQDGRRSHEYLARRLARTDHRTLLDVHLENKAPYSIDQSFDLITPYSDHWNSLVLNSWGPECVSTKLPSTLPSLRHLTINCSDSDTAMGLEYHLTSEMPHIETASLTSLPLNWKTCTLATLKSLELSRCMLRMDDIPYFFDFLGQSPFIERLVLDDIWKRYERHTDTHPPIRLESLKELVWRDIPSSAVLTWIDAPNLESLFVGRPLGMERSQLWEMVELSYPKLAHLELFRVSRSLPALVNLLFISPNITHLTIRSSELGRLNSELIADVVLQRQTLKRLTNLVIHGTYSLPQLRVVVMNHTESLKELRIHSLDTGLSEGSCRREFEEQMDALKWFEYNVPNFHIDESIEAYGTRYKTWDDMVLGQFIRV